MHALHLSDTALLTSQFLNDLSSCCARDYTLSMILILLLIFKTKTRLTGNKLPGVYTNYVVQWHRILSKTTDFYHNC